MILRTPYELSRICRQVIVDSSGVILSKRPSVWNTQVSPSERVNIFWAGAVCDVRRSNLLLSG